MSEDPSINIKMFQDVLKQSFIQYETERDRPHPKCQLALNESYNDLLTVVNDIKHTVDKVAADVTVIKRRQDDLDNKLIMLQQVTAEHTGRIKDLEEWKTGVDNIQKAVRKRVFVTIWAAITSSVGLGLMAAWEYIKSHADLTFK